MKVLVTEPISARSYQLLSEAVEVVQPGKPDWAQVIGLVSDVEGIIVRRMRVSRELIDSAKKLRVIGRHGVGTDTVDLDYATARGIPVVYTPGANAVAVAEYTLALMLALLRKTCRANLAARSRSAEARADLVGSELRRKCIGIIGLGRIGLEVARICAQGFHMQVVGYDPYAFLEPLPEGVERCATLEELLREADIVTLHVPFTEETRGMINAVRLAEMKPSAVLINTARGGVVVEADLCRALEAGQLAGAALDVLSTEPLPTDSSLLDLDNVILSPHIGAQTYEAMDRMGLDVVQGVLAVLRGERPPYLANVPIQGRLADREA